MDDRSISLERANVLALALIPALALLVFGPLILLGRFDQFAAGWRTLIDPIVFIPGFILTVVVHEGLHAIGFLLGGASRENIHFGIHTSSLSPYAGCRIPMRARAYRLSVVLPALVLGVIPWIVGMAIGSGFLVVVAFWMLAFAGGDLLILWVIRDLPPGAMVIDHPERAGCQVLEPPSTSGALRGLCVAALLLLAQAPATRAQVPISELGWLAGCWERRSGDLLIEEQWNEPRAGAMLGTSRTTRGDALLEYEYIGIHARGDSLVYVALPSGQARTEFYAAGVRERSVVFENPDHDYPQRVIYRAVGADSLLARIEGSRDGETRGSDFPFARVACTGGR